ncbi:disease resistance protein SUMM2 [Neltuma alba]|uniref:disease resistance protein SUMM2 n=1 Tax=Neltuma alba TaxID=207710 RepID=UPI0010A570F8|nr:disease resistance protein SUMM2-like [Prosopis alba]
MESIPVELVKNETQSLVNLVKNEAQYICCFNSYVQEYEQAKGRLKAKLEDVSIKINQARGVSLVTSVALQWTRDAEELINVDTKKEKCFNDLCLNCWPQYQKGRDLAKRTLDIDRLLKICNFDIVVGLTDLPGIKYHCLPNFTHFESRKSIFKELQKALEDEGNNMIGLEGLGGTGKTSMATEVGAELEGSTFGKVIFLVVSKLPDFKHLRGEIAGRLDLKSEDGEYHEKILTKIKALKEKLLIVLDDVWVEFDLRKELGIPPPHLHKGCTILITTRSKEICTKMDCQRIIHLQALTDKEALQLFLEHANSSSTLENLAQKIVKHCHGVPVVIVAVARSLKDRPFKVWTEALRNLQSGESIFNVRDEDLKKVYEGLKLSYDNLRNEKAKKLLLISSLFPEDFNIPMEFLIIIGVGMGPFGKEVDDYNKRRRKSLDAVVELLGSSLLLNAERECVKMHDLVHEVALLIGQEDIQSIIKSELSVKKGLQCLYWKNDDFLRPFDSQNLEVLFLVREDQEALEVPDTFFIEMTKLKVLFLQNKAWHRISAPSLFPLIQLLQDIRTLWIKNFNLHSNISMLGGLSNLETLWLDDCSIIKPGKKFELQKLRFLRIENCDSNMNNPFELIEACPKLEELAFLSNDYVKQEEDTISQKPGSLTHLISEATFRQLARTAELLSLSGYGKQKNLIPDIVPVDDTGMTDLIILQLDSWPDMQCLIDAVNNRFDVKNAFSNLVGLYLSKMGLSNILFNGHYNLCHLKTLKLKECPKLTSIFLPSTAQSLLQLEELNIKRCDALECIVEDQSSRGEIAGGDGDNDQKSYGTLFPKFKILKIDSCDNLEIILPILHGGWHLERIIIQQCKKLKYIFDKFQEVNVMLPSLERMQLVSLSSLATSEEADVAVSTGRLLDKGISQGLLASKKWIDNAPTLGRQLALHVVGHIRKMELAYLSSNSLSTLFTLSMASAISWKELTIIGYDGLKHLVTSEEDDYKDEISCSSIFPKLQELHISKCNDLEFLFLSAISIEIKNLKSLIIEGAPQLTYVIEKYQHHHRLSNQNQNDEWHFGLPALEVLCLDRVTKFISIGPMNYKMVSPSLQHICSDKAQLNSNTTKGLFASKKWIDTAPTLGRQLALYVVGHIRKMKLAYVSSNSGSTLFTLSMASVISWEEMTIRGYDGLKHLVTSEEDDYKDEINCRSIFPKLQELHISECKDLEFLFLSAISIEIKNLKSLIIEGAPQLTYVIEKYQHQHRLSYQNQNDEWHFGLPALEVLCLEKAPKFISIGPMNYTMVSPSLQHVCSDKAQLNSNTTKLDEESVKKKKKKSDED